MIKMKDIDNILKRNYLIGINVSNKEIEITFIDKINYKVTKEQMKKKDEYLFLLHNYKRRDLTEIYDSIINELYIEETNDMSSSNIDFTSNFKNHVFRYYVSKNIARQPEELEFIENYVKLFCKNKEVYDVDNNVLDIFGLYDSKKISYDSDIYLLDKDSNISKLHIKGKTICPYIMTYIESRQELNETVKER